MEYENKFVYLAAESEINQCVIFTVRAYIAYNNYPSTALQNRRTCIQGVSFIKDYFFNEESLV